MATRKGKPPPKGKSADDDSVNTDATKPSLATLQQRFADAEKAAEKAEAAAATADAIL